MTYACCIVLILTQQGCKSGSGHRFTELSRRGCSASLPFSIRDGSKDCLVYPLRPQGCVFTSKDCLVYPPGLRGVCSLHAGSILWSHFHHLRSLRILPFTWWLDIYRLLVSFLFQTCWKSSSVSLFWCSWSCSNVNLYICYQLVRKCKYVLNRDSSFIPIFLIE